MSTLAARFEAKVDRSPGHGPWGDCHLWTDKPTEEGYGVIHTADGPRLAHRVALAFAGIDLGPVTHHRCEVKLCVNTAHLERMTRATHMSHHMTKTHCKRGHSLAGDNLYVRKDNGQRTCRRCQRERRKRRYETVEKVNAGRTF